MKKTSSIIAIFLLLFIHSLFATEGGQNEEAEAVKLTIGNVKDINKTNIITIQALNKITAKSYKYDVRVGDTIEFERLKITPLFCWTAAPDEVPENKALIKVFEKKIDKKEEKIFYGWMFSSSPGLSSLEHPMYDITLVECKNIEEN